MSETKIQVISRRQADFGRHNLSEAPKIYKNTSPELHPMAVHTEYKRALNAAKMEKMFSKPFIGSMEGHSETVTCLTRDPTNNRRVISGGLDGEIRIWDTGDRNCVSMYSIGDGGVNDVTCAKTSDLIMAATNIQTICGFKDGSPSFMYHVPKGGICQAIDYSYSEDYFVTASSVISIWDPVINRPIHTFNIPNTRSFQDCVYNMNETDLICACDIDRGIYILDKRQNSVARHITLYNKSNAVDWNPYYPFYFIAANDDSAIYMFDIRKTDGAFRVYTDHLGPVTCVNFSPTGKQFVSGSTDQTIRVWSWDKIKSENCYHTKRMQAVQCCCVSPDSKFVLSGSHDMSIRIFKMKANEQLKAKSKKEVAAQNYNEKLLEKFSHQPEIQRIVEKQNLPKKLHKQRYERAKMYKAEERRAFRRMAHSSNPDANAVKPLRQRRVVDDKH